jgi:hypothetical protein
MAGTWASLGIGELRAGGICGPPGAYGSLRPANFERKQALIVETGTVSLELVQKRGEAQMKKLVAISLAALAGTVLLYAGSLLSGRHWFDFLFLVPLWAGGWASGSLHQPNEFVSWLTTFVQFWVLGFLCVGAARLIRGRRGDS